MTQLTSNTTAFIEAQQYSQFIIENLEPFLLPEIFWRDVSDFQKGTTLNIKTIGDVTLQEAAEDVPPIVLRGRPRNARLPLRPLMGLPGVVRSLDEVGNPADLALGVEELQPRELLELAREEPVDHRGDTIEGDQICRDDGLRILRRPHGARARADVHRDHRLRLLTGGEEGIPVAGLNRWTVEPGG